MASWGGILTLGLAAILIAGCQSSVPKTAHFRTSDEIRQAIGTEGLTTWGHNPAGNDFESYTAPNGTAVVRSGTFVDHGVWHIAPGGKFCLKWQHIRDGAETCLTQSVNGSDIYNILPDGSVASVVTREAPGNPDHL